MAALEIVKEKYGIRISNLKNDGFTPAVSRNTIFISISDFEKLKEAINAEGV